MSTTNESYNKFMTYTARVDNILYDFRIPCYYYVCPKCNKSYLIPNCQNCNKECERKSYEYSFFNNQLYQKRISASNEAYYVTIIDNFRGRLTGDNKSNNNISYKRYIRQLSRKCTLYFNDERIVLKNDDSEHEDSKEIKEDKISTGVKKMIKSNIKAPMMKTKAESNNEKLCKEIFNKLRVYDVKLDCKVVNNFVDAHSEYNDIRDTLLALSEGNIYKNLYYIDELLAKCNLFKIDTDSYEGLIEYTNDKDVKLFIELCFMFIHAYVVACCNLSSVKKIIDQYRKTNIDVIRNNFLTDNEYDSLFTKLQLEKDARKFDIAVSKENLSTNKIIGKLKYIKLFSYDVLKVIDE